MIKELIIRFAYIDSGRYLRNFLQRIRRIGRGREESEIYCVTPVAIVERIKKLVKDGNITYYEFVEVLLNNSFEDIKLKKEKSLFYGSTIMSTYNVLKYPERRRAIDELIEKFPIFEGSSQTR